MSFLVPTLVIGALLAITGCSRQAGPISGGDLVSFAVDNFDAAEFQGDSAATKALCSATNLDDSTTTEFKDGLVDLCKATQNYWGQTFGPKVDSVAVSLGWSRTWNGCAGG